MTEPNKWQVRLLANVGMGEEFVKRMTELHALVDAGEIVEPQRQVVKEAITEILTEGLMPAFLKLREIRASARNKEVPLMDRQQLYEDFARKVWKSHKELTEKAAREMGFKIGFLFDNDKKFHEGLAEFRRQNPRARDWFEKLLEEARAKWQNELAKFRNTWIEHPHGDRKAFAKFYTVEYAELLFDAVWRTIADILPVLLELHFVFRVQLVEQDPNDPGPRWEQRFRYSHPAFTKSE